MTEFCHDDYSELCLFISNAEPVAFYGRTDRKYDIRSCPCTWAVITIKEWPIDRVDPPKPWGKGESYGLNVWEVLAYIAVMGDIYPPAPTTIGDTGLSVSSYDHYSKRHRTQKTEIQDKVIDEYGLEIQEGQQFTENAQLQ